MLRDLACLGEEHQNARTLVGLELIAFFFRAVGNGKAIAVLVVNRFAVNEQDVMMRAIALDMMNGDMPAVDRTVVDQRDFLPVGEATGDFHGSGGLGLAVGQTPSKYLGKSLLAFGGVAPLCGDGRGRFWNERSAFAGRFAPEQIAKRLKHNRLA